MKRSPTWANYILFFVTSAHAVCTGDIVPRLHQERLTTTLKPPRAENIQSGPSYYYHYQQHRGQPAQKIHIEYPQQQSFSRWLPNQRPTPKSPESAPNPTPPPYTEYPTEDSQSEERKNSSNKLYFEDHNGNDTHREHHYRHVTVNHYFYNGSENSAPSNLKDVKGKDVKHYYYYNEYKHDHRNKTGGNATKHYTSDGNPDVKHHYYYNEYKHDHRNKTGDSNVKHYYTDHRNKTEDPIVKQYYNEYKQDRNKTDESNVRHYYYSDYRNISESPKVKHYYYKDDQNVTTEKYDDYDESGSEEGAKQEDPNPLVTDVHGIEDYEYVSDTTPKPIVKHHHYYKEYYYNNGRLVKNTTSPNRPSYVSNIPYSDPTKSSNYVSVPLLPVVKNPFYEEPYDKRFAYNGYPVFGWVKQPLESSPRNKKPLPNNSLGYFLVDPLGRLPTLKIHASVIGPWLTERPSRRAHSPYPEATPRHQVTRKSQASTPAFWIPVSSHISS